MTRRILCIYHGFCDDGFAAAWSVRHALRFSEVEYYAGVYQQAPPDVTGRDVILVDFSYKRPVIEVMMAAAKSLLILDRHATAREDLSGLPGIATVSQWGDRIVRGGQLVGVLFDMERSGAGIAWDFFHPDRPRPEFINYVEDRELWRKALPGGDEFTIALRSYPQEFEVWDGLVAGGASALIAEGKSIQRYYRLRVEEIKRSAYLARLALVHTTGPAPADVPVALKCGIANAPYFAASEVAGELCEMEGADFGACYFEVAKGCWQYSLRSRDGFDVSEVAKAFGGGGHKGAAGFTVPAPVHF